uniref:SERTA domain-containing protein 2 n=1 Tax=Cacopsylla melanoneura TaxID=428564 RepID=A0A8D8TKS1_9HEMI
MWSDCQDPSNIMGVQPMGSKRKLVEECVEEPAGKIGRLDDWCSEEEYFPSGKGFQESIYTPLSPSQDYCMSSQWRSSPSRSPQQTIRCEENGKSYLDLGSWNSNSANNRCCEGRTNWCSRGPSCYRQRRLAVLNISMCKLGRYRQFSDPSLHRSVLICNTLRLIEREMEQEGCLLNSMPLSAPPSVPPPIVEPPPPCESLPCEPPRVPTPYPSSSSESDSGLGDDSRSINWGSVLSLSSNSDLDPLNNNDSLDDLDLDLSVPWKLTPTPTPCSSSSSNSHLSHHSMSQGPPAEFDNIMHVLVGS